MIMLTNYQQKVLSNLLLKLFYFEVTFYLLEMTLNIIFLLYSLLFGVRNYIFIAIFYLFSSFLLYSLSLLFNHGIETWGPILSYPLIVTKFSIIIFSSINLYFNQEDEFLLSIDVIFLSQLIITLFFNIVTTSIQHTINFLSKSQAQSDIEEAPPPSYSSLNLNMHQ